MVQRGALPVPCPLDYSWDHQQQLLLWISTHRTDTYIGAMSGSPLGSPASSRTTGLEDGGRDDEDYYTTPATAHPRFLYSHGIKTSANWPRIYLQLRMHSIRAQPQLVHALVSGGGEGVNRVGQCWG